MASIIIDKKKSGDYIRIVESYRVAGKAKTRTLYTLGRVDSFSPSSLKRMGERLFVLGGGHLPDLLGESIQEEGRYNYGFYQIYQKIFAHYGLDRLLDRISKRKKLGYSLSKIVLFLLLERCKLLMEQ